MFRSVRRKMLVIASDVDRSNWWWSIQLQTVYLRVHSPYLTEDSLSACIYEVCLREALLARDRRKWGLTEMLDILYDEGHDRDCDCVIETKLRCSEHRTILSWFLGRRLCRWQSCATWTNNVQPACDDDNFKHQNQAFMCQSMLCVSHRHPERLTASLI